MHTVRRSVNVLVLLIVACLVLSPGAARSALLGSIDDPSFTRGGEFGSAVAVAGSDVFVGAPGTPVLGHDGAGVVRLFGELFGVDRALSGTFDAVNPVAGAALGTAIVVRDGRLYAGAPGDRPFGVGGLGAVYVFAPTGVIERIIRSPDPDAGTAPVGGAMDARPGLPQSTAPRPVALDFGRAIAVAPDRIVVGAPGSIVEQIAGAGAAYLYNGAGTLRQTLTEFSPSAGARFGASVALIGNEVFVGAPGASDGGADGAGVVAVFDALTGSRRRTLSAPVSREGAAFGAVVGEVAGALFVGAPGTAVLGARGAGAVYLFDVDGSVARRTITAPVPSAGMSFGGAIAAVDANLVVGADGAGPNASGRAFLIDAVTTAVRATFEPALVRTNGHFGFAVAGAGVIVAIGEPLPGVSTGIGRVYLFDVTASVPSGGGAAHRPPSGPVVIGPLDASCPGTGTVAAADCRLGVLLASVRRAGLPRLAPALRRARRTLRRAASGRGFDRAARSVRDFVARLDSANPGPTGDVRAALLAVASALEADVATLTRESPPARR